MALSGTRVGTSNQFRGRIELYVRQQRGSFSLVAILGYQCSQLELLAFAVGDNGYFLNRRRVKML